MKLQWSLVVLANSLIVVSVGALDYLKSQTLHLETAPSSAAGIARPFSVIVALGRLEPEGRIIHCSAAAQAGNSRLEQLLVKQGDYAKKGEVLAILNGRAEHEAAFEQAGRQLAVAQAELDQTKAPPKRNELNAQQSVVLRLEAELSNAKKEQARYRALYTDGAVSASLLDAKDLAVDVEQQQLEQARASLANISEIRPVDIAVASAHVESAKSAVTFAQAQLDMDYIRAPIAGQILKINTHAGEMADGKGILDLGNTSSMIAVADVYESDASRLRLGQSTFIQCDAVPGKIHGVVQEIGWQIEKKQTLEPDPAVDADSRIVEVRIKIDARDCPRVSHFSNSHIKATINSEPEKTCTHLPGIS